MKLAGKYEFEAPRDLVWQSLQDPDVLAKIIPGCEKLDEVGENEYEGMLNIKVGPVQGKFKGAVKLFDINPPEGYSLQIDGRGAPGFLKGTGSVRLEDQGAATVLHYEGDAQVGGRIASVGQRLLDSSAKSLTRQSLEGLKEYIQSQQSQN